MDEGAVGVRIRFVQLLQNRIDVDRRSRLLSLTLFRCIVVASVSDYTTVDMYGNRWYNQAGHGNVRLSRMYSFSWLHI